GNKKLVYPFPSLGSHKREPPSLSAIHFAAKPCAGDAPLALDGCVRDAENFGGLFNGKPAEVTQFDYTALLRIHLFQTLQRIVELDQFMSRRLSEIRRFIERKFLLAGAPLGEIAGAGMLHKNLSHQTRGDAEEMSATLPRNVLIDQPQISFINQRGG